MPTTDCFASCSYSDFRSMCAWSVPKLPTDACLHSPSSRTRCWRSLRHSSQCCSQTSPATRLRPHCMISGIRYPASPIPSQRCRPAALPKERQRPAAQQGT
ncbi:hypothetical protein MRX96_014661 [Rhipicephalus microplus]